MNVNVLLEKLPLVRSWIEQTLREYAPQATPIASLQFPRLPAYFPKELLALAKVVVTDHQIMLPLSKFGLAEFADFERGKYEGITYVDTCFIKQASDRNESVYFHELVHVLQWQYLGIDRFLLAYSIGLLQHGYRNSPLEVMAYSHGGRFDKNALPYDVEGAVRAELRKLGSSFLEPKKVTIAGGQMEAAE